jgi:hypothetical protein
MPRRLRRLALLAVALLCGTTPLYAQEADTTADAPAPDTAAVDTTTPTALAADSVRADTLAADTLAADTLAADTLAADTAAARADSLAALRRQRRRARRKAAQQQARTAAEEWLALTDAGDFGASWEAADSTLQAGISRDDWIDQGRRVRSRLDTIRARRLTRSTYRDSTARLPGAGPVVLLQYTAETARGSILEAVVTTKRDTTWTVAGYRVVPASAADSARAAPASPSPDDGS